MTDTTTTTPTGGTSSGTPVQVYRVWIRATAEAIWEAITSPEWSDRYGYGGTVEYDLRPGGAYRTLASAEMKSFGAPDVVVDGEVLEADPPHRLVQTWRMLMDPDNEPEGFTTLTYEIDPPARRGLPAHPHPRPDQRAPHGAHHRRQQRGRGRRRVAVGPQRAQDAAGDRRRPGRPFLSRQAVTARSYSKRSAAEALHPGTSAADR